MHLQIPIKYICPFYKIYLRHLFETNIMHDMITYMVILLTNYLLLFSVFSQ